jgi:hypothetical protein
MRATVVVEQRKTAERPLGPSQPEVEKRKQEKPDSWQQYQNRYIIAQAPPSGSRRSLWPAS